MLEEIGQAVPLYAELPLGDAGHSGRAVAAAALPRVPRAGSSRSQVAPVPPRRAGSFWLVSGPVLWDGGHADAARHQQVLQH